MVLNDSNVQKELPSYTTNWSATNVTTSRNTYRGNGFAQTMVGPGASALDTNPYSNLFRGPHCYLQICQYDQS